MCTLKQTNKQTNKHKPVLILYYQNRLEKVKSFWKIDTNSTIKNERAQSYIDYATKELNEVKNGRMY